MSSILNALNKVEEEQDQLKAQEYLRPEDIDPADAVDDLLSTGSRRDKMTLQVTPVTLVGGAILTLIVLVATVAFVVATVMKPDAVQPPDAIASLPPAINDPIPPVEPVDTPTPSPSNTTPPTQPVEKIPAPIKEPPTTPVVNTSPSVPVAETTPPAPVVDTTPPAPMVEEPIEVTPPAPIPEKIESKPVAEAPKPKPEPKVIEKKPEPLPKHATTVLEETGPLNFEPSTPKPAQTVKESEALIAQNDKPIDMYPRFTKTIQMKYGLDTFKINMVSPQSARNPYGSALINREKIFEGNYIAGSQVILHKVEKSGVAFEIPRTGKRYYSKF